MHELRQTEDGIELRISAAAFRRSCRRLFRSANITRVVLTDRRPNDVGPGYAWCWAVEGLWRRMPDSLPTELFDGFVKYGLVPPGCAALWDTREEADEALSRLCVAHGRAVARGSLVRIRGGERPWST